MSTDETGREPREHEDSRAHASGTDTPVGEIRPGDRVTAVVERRDIEWPDSTRGRDKPLEVTVTGTVSPSRRDHTVPGGWVWLLDTAIRTPEGDLFVEDDVMVRLADMVQVEPADRRDDLLPQPATADQVRVGDLLAQGPRGEVITEIAYAVNDRGARTFTSHDPKSGQANRFVLLNTEKVALVPRERRRPEDAAAVLGRHDSTAAAQRAATDARTLFYAVSQALESWLPEQDVPLAEVELLGSAIRTLDTDGNGREVYDRNAVAMDRAAEAAGALVASLGDAVLDTSIGRPLHNLRQHLDMHAVRLRADTAYLDQRAQERQQRREATAVSAPAPAPEAPAGQGPQPPPDAGTADGAKEPRPAHTPPRFATVTAARNHLDAGARDPRWERPPRTHNGVHLRGASATERAKVRIDTYSARRDMDYARTSQLSEGGNFLVTRNGVVGKWNVYHVGSGTIMTHQAGHSNQAGALDFANALEAGRDRQDRPIDWNAPYIGDRLAMAEGRGGIEQAIDRGRGHQALPTSPAPHTATTPPPSTDTDGRGQQLPGGTDTEPEPAPETIPADRLQPGQWVQFEQTPGGTVTQALGLPATRPFYLRGRIEDLDFGARFRGALLSGAAVVDADGGLHPLPRSERRNYFTLPAQITMLGDADRELLAARLPEGRPHTDEDLRERWKAGGDVLLPPEDQQRLTALAANPETGIFRSSTPGFALVEDRTTPDASRRWRVVPAGTGRDLGGPGSMIGYFPGRELAEGFAASFGLTIGDADGYELDWGDPELDSALDGARTADGQTFATAVAALAAAYEAEHPPAGPGPAAVSPAPAPDAPRTEGGRTNTSGAEAEAAPPTDDATARLLAGARPVDGVPGYRVAVKGGSSVTVFGPDDTVVASARWGGEKFTAGQVGETRLVSYGIGEGRLTSFAEVAARHHRAAADPGARDRVWVQWAANGTAIVHGDRSNEADQRAAEAGSLQWSREQQAWVTGERWNSYTRDSHLAETLMAFARQDRNVVVLRPGQTLDGLDAPRPGAGASLPVQTAGGGETQQEFPGHGDDRDRAVEPARFPAPEEVLRHWRDEEGDPFRIAETKDEASNRRATVSRREERASEVELVGEALVIARMHYPDTGRYRWGVFHAGTAQPVLMMEGDQEGAEARSLAEALDQWRDRGSGEPFDWASMGLVARLRSPYGVGMLDQVRDRDPEARWAGSAPADARSWETDDGQEYAYDSSYDKVAVYDPDGLLIARGAKAFDPNTKKSAFIGEMRDGRRISGQWADHFVQNAVWQHRIAQMEPAARDGLWIYYLDHRPIVHGTDKYAADWPDMKALLRSAGFTWSGYAKAYVTAGTTRAVSRAQSVDRLARALYAQGRMVEIRADEDRLRGVLAPAAAAPAAARAAVLAPGAAAAPGEAPPAAAPAEAPPAAAAVETAAPPAPEARPVLTAQDLTDEQLAAELRRLDEERRSAAYGSARSRRLDEQIAPLKQERDLRDVAQVENRPGPAGMEDGEIAAEREVLAPTVRRGPYGHEDRTPLGVARRERDELLRVEQARRTAAELEARPPVAQMTDEDLQAEGAQLVKASPTRPPEAADAFRARVAAVGGEIADRRLLAWGEQPPADGLDDVELSEALETVRGQRLRDTEFAGSHPDKQRVENAFDARRHVLRAEVKQRDEKAFVALLESDGRIRLETYRGHDNTRTRVRIDNRYYGQITDLYGDWRAELWRGGRDDKREEAWRTDALRWMIERYEKDPETRDTRTWGPYVDVELPPSFVDQFTTHFGDLTGEEAEKYLLDQAANSSRTQSFDARGNKLMVHALALPERTLPFLERMGRRLVDRLDQELDSDDRKTREKAKRARPNVLRALDDITELMGTRGLGPLGTDNASAGTPQDGETDSERERVRDDGPPALGDVPAAGAGADGGPGGVLPGPGDGRAGTDRGADPGEDGRSDAGDGPPAAGGQAESGPADGPGAGAEGDRVPGAGGGEPERGAAAPLVRFRPASQEDLAPAGERAKAAANLEAVRVLKQVREDKRAATAAEQQVMARWSGWGSVPEIFAFRPSEDDPVFGPGGEREGGYAAAVARWESFGSVRDPLRVLLDDDEWRAAAASTLSAHYTPPEITSALWQALADLGFDGGEVLEPGSGAGVTFGTAPESAMVTGVEIDPTSAAISRLLAPGVAVLNESFADTVAPDGAFDAVVGNVPFARLSLFDPKHNRGRHRIHNHFLVKSVALTRPGGVVALITSRHTMDAESATARGELFEMADLLGAVRLPNKAFARSAGTDVVTDILILRRRMDGEEPLDRSWLTSTKRQVGEHQLPVNDYFAAHSEHVLGNLTSRMGAHGPEVAVDGDPDVGEAVRTALRQITDSAVLARRWYAPHPDGPHRPVLRLKPAADLQNFTGRLSADVDGKLWQASGGGEQTAVVLPADQHAQLAALIELKDLVRGLHDLDRSGSGRALADTHRRLTKQTYQRYAAAYGALSRPRQQQNATTQTDDGTSVTGLTAWGYFLNDPQAYEVLALEMWEAGTETVHVSEILDHAPATRRSVLGQHTDDAQQALDAVVAERGHVDLPHIAWMLQTDEDEARRRLARSVFTDPLTGELLYSADYLSGDVRTKLEIARTAARRDAAYAVNVAELERVQPREMLPGQFAVRLGAGWLPDDLVQQFFREYLGDAHLTIQHSGNGNWHILKGRGLSEEDEVRHSAGGLHPLALLNRVLGGGSMTGRPSDDEEAARAVRVKADEWKDAFEAWVLDDSARAARAAEVYNRQMNNRVVRDFTGTRPSLAGLDPGSITPYDHQLAAAARMAHERCLVLSHVVGAGKTGALTIGMMAMKNTGQVDKPMVAVPNYLVEEWEDTVRRLYPAARILTLTSADVANGKRDRMFQYIRSNSFDMIIMSHSLFDSIPLSPEFHAFYNDEELRKLDAQIMHERRREGKSISLKQLQERRQQHEQDLKAKAAGIRTPGQVYFDDLGLDFVAVDEAHEYKNLAVRSKIPGARVAGSAKAQHLHTVLEWARLNKPTGPIGCLATGTPLSNAIGELHSLLLLAAPDLLRALGIEEFDAFATMYGKMVERLEMTVDGKGFKSVERFASFHSVNSLLRQLWLPVVDFKDDEDLGLVLPGIRGGEPELMLVPATADQQQRMEELGERYEACHLGQVDKSEDNALSINNDARIIALDPRLIDADAEPGNKLRLLADRVAAEYHETKNNQYTYTTEDLRPHPVPGALQAVFLNQGTPGGSNRGNFNAYQEFKDLLIARDVPAEKIDFIHDASRADQRRKLIARANHGGSNVLIGSTQRMGKGLNIQNRLTTVYHVDPDHRPADMKQKDGRGRRKGNQNKVVGIVWVATEGTFDSRQYGTLATKAKAFDQVYKARLDEGSDEIQEVDEAIVPFEEAMAIISGNPYLIAQGDLRKQLRRLTIDQNNRATQRAIISGKVGKLNKDIDGLTLNIARRGIVLPSLRPVIGDDFEITLGGTAFTKHKDAAGPLMDGLAGAVQALPADRQMTRDLILGQLGGLDLVAVAYREDNHDVPYVRVHLDGLPGSLQRFDAIELSMLKGETLLRRLTKTITEAPQRQIEDEGNLTAKRATRDDLLVQHEQLRGQVPGLGRARERLSLVDSLVVAQIAVNKAGKPKKDEPSTETEGRKKAVDRRDALQQQLDQLNAAPPEEVSPQAGEALLDLDDLRPRGTTNLSHGAQEQEAAILRASIAVHGDPDGTSAARLAELGMSLVEESPDKGTDGFVTPVANRHADDQQPVPEPPAESAAETTDTGSAGSGGSLQELIDGFGDRVVFGHVGGPPPSLESPGEAGQPADQLDAPAETAPDPSAAQPAPAPAAADASGGEAEARGPDGDGYGTADLYETFGLPQPEHVPAPAPQDQPGPEPGAEEPAGVPDGQLTVDEAQPQAPTERDAGAGDARRRAAAEERRAANLAAAAVLRYYEPLLAVVGLSGADAVSQLSGETAPDQAGADFQNAYARLMDDIARRSDRVGGISERGREITTRHVAEDRHTLRRRLTDLVLGVSDVRQGRDEPYGIDLAAILAAPDSRFALPDTPAWRLAAAVPTGQVVVAHDPETGYAVYNTYRRRRAGDVLRGQRFRWDPDAVPEGVWRPGPGQSEDEQHRAVRSLLDALTEAGIAHAAHGRMPGPTAEPAPETPRDPGPADTADVPGERPAGDEVQPETPPAGPEPALVRDDGRERLISADGRLRFTLLRPPPAEEVDAAITAGWQRTRSEFAAQVDTYDEQAGQSPQERADRLAEWRRTFKVDNGLEPFRPLPSLRLTRQTDTPGLVPKEYGIGSWVTWRDRQSGQEVTGQVTAPGAAGDTWFVSTDRSGHTGEYHVLSRHGKKATGYTYSLNGATDLRPADGPGAQVPLEDLPEVDSVPARPVTPYADYVPKHGYAPVRETVPVTVGEMGPRFNPTEVAFDVTADGIPFVVRLSQNDDTLTSTFVPRIESDGNVIIESSPLDSRAEAVDFCVGVARTAREMADKQLYANYRYNDLALAVDGACGDCVRNYGDNDTQELYRLNGGDPQCIDHVTPYGVDKADVLALARARRIWATRVDPDTTAAADTAAPADAEQVAESPAAPAEQQMAAAAAVQEPHEVDRETLRGGDRITAGRERQKHRMGRRGMGTARAGNGHRHRHRLPRVPRLPLRRQPARCRDPRPDREGSDRH